MNRNLIGLVIGIALMWAAAVTLSVTISDTFFDDSGSAVITTVPLADFWSKERCASAHERADDLRIACRSLAAMQGGSSGQACATWDTLMRDIETHCR